MHKTIKELRQVCEELKAARLGRGGYDYVRAKAKFELHCDEDTVLQLLDQLAAAQLTWTTEKPTKAGWYWYGRKNKVVAVFFVDQFGKLIGDYELSWDDFTGGEWAGPIPTPGGRDE